MTGRLLSLILILSACTATQTPPTPASPPPKSLPANVPTIPTSAPSPIPTPTNQPATRLLFTGDINPGRCVAQIVTTADDYTLPYHYVAAELLAADITIGSLDGSITDRAAPMNCPRTMNLVGPSRMVEGFQFAGFDVISVGTNHIKNCGFVGCWDDALLDSMATLEVSGIAPVGGGDSLAAARAPVIIERNGVHFAFLAASSIGKEMWATETEPGTAPLTSENLTADIAAAREIADVVIVLPQWGGEYKHLPDWDQFRLAGDMMEAGATLVIGNQAHWVQAVEEFPNGVVAYALGNFVFDQYWSEKTKQGMVFEAVFRGSTLESWRLIPIHIHDSFQPRWADEAEAAEILTNVQQASEQMKTERGAR